LFGYLQSLADCTRDMDGPTWNAYQIVGNRARAMCYATQQEQFRKLTEMTVSDLVTAATNQLDSMEHIKVRKFSGMGECQKKCHIYTITTMCILFPE
jgi:hypothetical protein